MADDPVATASQHEQEVAALELIEHPTVKAPIELWPRSGWPREGFRGDAGAVRRFVRRGDVLAVSSNQDKLRPKISCITRLAHPVDGQSIPGSRWGIDNPDSVYRVIRYRARNATRSVAGLASIG